MRSTKTDELLKIGELARATGVSVTTLKYYIAQGLLAPALKTSANMAYYDPSTIRRIFLIKQLQKEKFYPLSLIRELLGDEGDDTKLDLLGAIHKLPVGRAAETLRADRAAAATGLTQPQIDLLVERGVVAPAQQDGKPVFDMHDTSILHLVKKRCDAGLPFEQTLASFCIYARALDGAVQGDVDVMIRQIITPGTLSPANIAALIRTADATLDEFVSLKRDQLDSQYSGRRMHEFLHFIGAVRALWQWLAPPRDGPLCARAEELLGRLARLHADVDIAAGGAMIEQVNQFFAGMDAGEEPTAEGRLALYSIRLGFYTLAPGMFGWQEREALWRGRFEADCAPLVGAGEARLRAEGLLEKCRELTEAQNP